jgi:hypothetical protein
MAQPNFADKVKIVPNGHLGPALSAAADQGLAGRRRATSVRSAGRCPSSGAPGSRSARTRSRFSGSAMGTTRAGTWCGCESIGTATVSTPSSPTTILRGRACRGRRRAFRAPDEWTHLAFTWDETVGFRLDVGGVLCASKNVTPVLGATGWRAVVRRARGAASRPSALRRSRVFAARRRGGRGGRPGSRCWCP